MERNRRTPGPWAGTLPWVALGGAVVAACITVLTLSHPRSTVPLAKVGEVRMLFRSSAESENLASVPVEGFDPSTPLDTECRRYGYEYRVHLPAVPGPLCGVFYEDSELHEDEQGLIAFDIRSVVRFLVTPVSQALKHPVPEALRGKPRLTPQEFVRRDMQIRAAIGRAGGSSRDAEVLKASITGT